MSYMKGGPAWRVTRRFPKAHSLKQKGGSWKIVTGDRDTGNQVIGEAAHARLAWADADRRLK